MAAAPSARPASPIPAPSTPKRRNTSDGSSSGLRNSCESCANSKVKCSGRKPTCDRCEKRGFTCEYFQAKRAGRKPAGSMSSANNSIGETSQSDKVSEPNNETAAATETAYASPRGTASEISDIWGDLNPLDRSLFAELSNVNEISTGLTPTFPMELPPLDAAAPTAPMTSTDNLYSSTNDVSLDADFGDLSEAALEASNNAAADLFAFPLSTPGATGLATPVTRDSQSLQRSPTTSRHCSCLAQALGLMRRLSELMCTTSSDGLAKSDEDAIRTVQDILQQNKTAIDTASGMLNCPGRHDGYLLIIICLTAFKTIELFGAAVPEAPQVQGPQTRRPSRVSSSDSNVAHGGGYRIEGVDWARQSGQAILSELHSVRRLTKLLSEKLRIQSTATSSASSITSSLAGASSASAVTPSGSDEIQTVPKDVALFDGEVRLPFSAEVYRQLEIDLDSRVKALSQQLIHRLRSF